MFPLSLQSKSDIFGTWLLQIWTYVTTTHMMMTCANVWWRKLYIIQRKLEKRNFHCIRAANENRSNGFDHSFIHSRLAFWPFPPLPVRQAHTIIRSSANILGILWLLVQVNPFAQIHLLCWDMLHQECSCNYHCLVVVMMMMMMMLLLLLLLLLMMMMMM